MNLLAKFVEAFAVALANRLVSALEKLATRREGRAANSQAIAGNTIADDVKRAEELREASKKLSDHSSR